MVECVDGKRPDAADHASLAASASAYRSPPTTRSAPYDRMRSILAGDEMVGTKIFAGTFRRMAAYATAAP